MFGNALAAYGSTLPAVALAQVHARQFAHALSEADNGLRVHAASRQQSWSIAELSCRNSAPLRSRSRAFDGCIRSSAAVGRQRSTHPDPPGHSTGPPRELLRSVRAHGNGLGSARRRRRGTTASGGRNIELTVTSEHRKAALRRALTGGDRALLAHRRCGLAPSRRLQQRCTTPVQMAGGEDVVADLSESRRSVHRVRELFDVALARVDRAESKRKEFGESWGRYIDKHPWEIDVRSVGPCTLEILATTRESAPVELSLIFSEWLSTMRASLDNGLYAWVVADTGSNPPEHAERIQYPICSSHAEFDSQAKRLRLAVPLEILEKVEKVQPYHSPYGPQSNLFYWIHELARTDRHRTPHVGLGRVDRHHIKLALPGVTTVTFDDVQPFAEIDGELVLARFTADAPLRPREIKADLRGVEIGPEIRAWAEFNMDGNRKSLQDRMVYAEIFTRNALENMALYGGVVPSGGFQTFDPEAAVAVD
jgi:hypothetical protein